MASIELRALFTGVDRCVPFAIASGAVLAVGGATVAICSTAMGSTNWKSLLTACCGAGLCIQSFATAQRCSKKRKEVDRDVFQRDLKLIRTIERLVSALLPDKIFQQTQNVDAITLRTLLQKYANNMESALSEGSFWNEIENFSKPFPKEKQYFAEMDRELYCQLKDLMSSDPNIEGGSLIIQETDLFEMIENLLFAHEAKCKSGLRTWEKEYEENAQLVLLLENNEPRLDINKDSPIREIAPGDDRDAHYLTSPKVFKSKVPNLGPEAPASKLDPSSSLMYPDSPSSHRDVYYPRIKPRSTPKKTPKKSPKHSGDTPKKTPEKSPKQSGSSSKKSPKSPKQSGSSSKKSPKSPKQSGSSSKKSPKSPKQSGSSSKKSPKSPKQSGSSSKKSPKSPKRSDDTPKKSPKSPKFCTST